MTKTITLELYGKTVIAGTSDIVCWLWVNSAWQSAGTINLPLTDEWETLDVSSLLNTTDKINNTRLKLHFTTGVGTSIWVYMARLNIDGVYRYVGDWILDTLGAGLSLVGASPYLYEHTGTSPRVVANAGITNEVASYWTFDDTYFGGPYVSVGTIDDLGSAIGPLNLPYARTNDAIQTIIEEMITTAFVPWEWWLTYAGELMVVQTRGSDKSASVIFQAGIHIGSSTKESSSKQTAQRVRTVGRGESAEQDQNTSDWYDDIVSMIEIGTFYERLVSEKELSEKGKADIWSQVVLAQDGPLREEVTVRLENDPYTASDFDVGDTVTVTDIDVGLSGKYRVKTIDKTVIGGESGGETTVVTLSNVRTDITDRLANYFKMLERMQHSSTYIDMMYAEGSKQRLLNANSIEDVWEQTASNKWATELPADEAEDPAINYCNFVGRGTINYECDKDEFSIWAVDVDCDGQVYLYDPLLKFSRDPRFTCEIEVDTDGDGEAWGTGDMCWIRVWEWDTRAGGAVCTIGPDGGFGDKGFGFEIRKTASNYELRAYLSTSKDPGLSVKVANILVDVKYTLEARMEWKERVVKYYFGKTDVDTSDPEWGFRLRAILPISVEAEDSEDLCPFHVVLDAASQTTKPKVYIYRWKTQAIRAVEG